MFWKFNQSFPQIDTILAKEDLTLDELFEQESLLQELKSQNKKLIEFVIRRDVLDQLVDFIIEEPDSELSVTEQYKRANLSCEVLTTDIPRVNESLANEGLLTKMFSFLEKDPPLNPLLASFFSRTLSQLICRKADQHWYSYQFTCLSVLDFFKTRNHSLDVLLKHLGTSAIMDLTLKLVTQVEGDEMQQNLMDWLESERFVDNLIDLFDPSIDDDRHYNAAQLLCQIIGKSRENSINQPDPLLSRLQSAETIQNLLKHMLNEDSVSESSINCGITVLLTLLEDPIPETAGRRGPYYDENMTGENNQPIVNPALPTIISAIIPSLPKFHNLLINPPKKDPIKLACGTIEPPLGIVRVSVIKLITTLIATNTSEVNEVLEKLNVVQVLLDLFFHYTWNNFLHTQVEKCLAFALSCPVIEVTENNPLLVDIFIKCRLLDRILDAWRDNGSEESKEGGKRRGYMGHLINIANSISKRHEEGLGDFFKQNVDEDSLNSWQEFVENSLKPINELHGRVLGGKHPSQNSGEDSSSDFATVPYSSETFEQNDNDSNFLETSVYFKRKDELKSEFEDSSEIEDDDFTRTDIRDRTMGEDLDDDPPPEYKLPDIDENYSVALDRSDSNPWAECAKAVFDDESWANFDMASFDAQFAQNLAFDQPTSSEPNFAMEEKPSQSEASDVVASSEKSSTISQATVQRLPLFELESVVEETRKDTVANVVESSDDVSIESVVESSSGKCEELEIKKNEPAQKFASEKVEIVANEDKLVVNNCNESSLRDSELVDNYRFLSIQGMINESDSYKSDEAPDTSKLNEITSEVPREVPEQVEVEVAPKAV